MIRPATDKDLSTIEDLHDQFYAHEFPFPSLDQIKSSVVVEDEKGIKGFASIQALAECVMILDLDRGRLDRSRTIDSLLFCAYAVSQRLGYSGIHAFVQSKKFAKYLKKNYGFDNSKGQVLYRSLG